MKHVDTHLASSFPSACRTPSSVTSSTSPFSKTMDEVDDCDVDRRIIGTAAGFPPFSFGVALPFKLVVVVESEPFRFGICKLEKLPWPEPGISLSGDGVISGPNVGGVIS